MATATEAVAVDDTIIVIQEAAAVPITATTPIRVPAATATHQAAQRPAAAIRLLLPAALRAVEAAVAAVVAVRAAGRRDNGIKHTPVGS